MTNGLCVSQNTSKVKLLHQVLAIKAPVMHKWFLGRWPEAGAWHAARLAFTRSAAVMSMVGHITGLGDRHGALHLVQDHVMVIRMPPVLPVET